MRRSAISSRGRTIWIAVVAATALAAAGPAADADAARLPSKSESKWIMNEFKAGSGHKGALVTLVRVSSADSHWARVRFLPKPKAGTHAAKKKSAAKNADVHKPSGSGKKKATKAPKPVLEEFAGPFIVRFALAINQGEETGHSSYGVEGGCGTVTRDVHVTFSASATFTIDLNGGYDPLSGVDAQGHPYFEATSFTYPTHRAAPPATGGLDNTYKYSDDETCPGGISKHEECTTHLTVDNTSAIAAIAQDQMGIHSSFGGLFHGGQPCKATAASNRWAQWPGDVAYRVPILKLNRPSSDLGEFPIDFLHNSGGHHVRTLHTGAFCDGYAGKGECSDTIDWSGTLTVSLPQDEQP
jgi:hypothetical protein